MLSNLIGTLNNYDDDVHGHITCPELGKQITQAIETY